MAAGKLKFSVDGKTVLVVHGTIEDEYWGKFDCSKDLSAYSDFDIVLMGHPRRPVFYEAFYPCEDKTTRNQKKTIFGKNTGI